MDFAHRGCGASLTPIFLNPSENFMANENDNHSWRGQTYTLEHTVERSIKNWCRALVEAGDPLCPEIADLAQTVRLKLWQAGAEIDRIWSDADPVDGGFRGVCRYVSRVCTNALIDARRYAKVRKADQHDSLDEPVYSKAGEIQGTVADRISDEEGSWQAFQFADLRGGEFGLSDEEFTVLEGSVANGATQQELAQDLGTSDSTVSRTYIRAKDKAA